METVSNVTIGKIDKSNYMQIYRVDYTQDGEKKIWDMMFKHDSVAILLHHIERDTFVFVKQFRPAVYISQAKHDGQDLTKEIDTTKTLPSNGCTYELCAGIVDKQLPLVQIAKEEVLEEVGYDVAIEKFEKITTCRSGVGTSGAQQTLYYVPVTESMKVNSGGGNKQEGELIDTVEVPVKDSYDFVMDEKKETPTGMLFAVLWYFHNKKK